jgi:hypothetical protein
MGYNHPHDKAKQRFIMRRGAFDMRGRLIVSSATTLTAFVLLVSGFGGTLAYESYRQSGGSCAECHLGFLHEGPLHERHVNMTHNCLLCHNVEGDVPKTFTSGDPEGEGCRGCHGVDNGSEHGWGIGLVVHHVNAGAPPDQSGRTCFNCHGDALPGHESETPVYYLRGDVNVKDPCSAMLPDGEDYNGDGRGLDNDGDLVYDMNDSDCTSAGVEDGPSQALSVRLLSISPNPVAAGGADIQYSLATASDVDVSIYTAAGQLVLRRQYSGLSPGRHAFRFRGQDPAGRSLPSGVYTVRIESEHSAVQGKVVLLH